MVSAVVGIGMSAAFYDSARGSINMALRLLKRGDDLSSRTSFEEAFASLAYAVQNDAIPKLSRHILGFQLLEKSEDERRAVGIIGLQLGSILAYAPFFFNDGEMSGNELLWLVKSDTFVPKTDDWIDYLIGLGARSIGTPIDRQLSRQNIGAPDLTAFRDVQAKTGSAVAYWAAPGLSGIYDAAAGISRYKGADLRGVISEPRLAASLVNIVDRHPRIGEYVSHFYGRGFLKRARRIAKHTETVFANVSTAPVSHIIPPKADSRLRIYTDVDLDDGALKPAEKLELLKKGYYIRDTRKVHSKVAAYDDVKKEVEKVLVTPTQTGIYDLLLNDGGFARCIVIDGKYVLYPVDKPRRLVYERPSFRSASPLEADRLLGQPVHISNAVVYEAGMSLEDAIRATDFPNYGDGEVPSRRWTSLLVGDKYGTWVKVRIGVPANVTRVDEWTWELDDDRAEARKMRIAYGDGAIDRIVFLPTLIVIPPTVAAFPTEVKVDRRERTVGQLSDNFLFTDKVVTPKAIGENNNNQEDNKSNSRKEAAVANPYRRLQLLSNATDVAINGRWMSKKAALFSLVRDHGIRENTALRMIKEAYLNRKVFLVKYAQVLGTAPAMPFPPEPVPSMDPLFGTPTLTNTIQTITPGSAHLSAPQLPLHAPLNPEGASPQLIAAVTEAARTGQKEVFDTAILSAMLSATNVFDIVEQHIPRLLKGVDAIGRLLFNIYWRKEEFEKRLGRHDLAKVKDTLKTIFTQLGNAVIALKERAAAGASQDIHEMMTQQEEQT